MNKKSNRKAVVIKNILVIYINVPFNGKYDENTVNENIYSINSEGNLVWRIQKISDAYQGVVRVTYTGITKRANDIMTVTDFIDRIYIVDPCTGEILGSHKASR